IPDPLYKVIQEAPLVEVVVSKHQRAGRILQEYGHFPGEQLAECTARLQKRLGGLRTQSALSALKDGNFDEWVSILLEYYDKTYAHGNEERKNAEIMRIEIQPGESHRDFAARILSLTNEMQLIK
ncbi:MAG TPA: hypothetical protein PLU53_09630, partial [Bacteroidia bacterium]|nr:hypothetical protein [Bacteroidia bacterium]